MADVRHLYPRSLLRLILLGNVLVALPLLAAVAYVVGSIGTLTERSETLTREASRAALLGWELPEDLGTMERILRQYEVLGDESLLDDYGAARREWVRVGAEYAAIPLLAELQGRLRVLLEAEAAGYEAVLAELLLDLVQRGHAEVPDGEQVLLRVVDAGVHAQAGGVLQALVHALQLGQDAQAGAVENDFLAHGQIRE